MRQSIPKDRSRTGAGNELTTERGRSAGRSCESGGRGDRPDVPERIRATVAAGGGRRQLLSLSPRLSVCVQCADGPDQQELRRSDGCVRETGTGSGRAVSQRGTERRDCGRAFEQVYQDRRGAFYRESAGEDAGVPDGASAE